jgi:hypothetical protein
MILRRQLRAYKATDPARNCQACLPIIVWLHIARDRTSTLTIALGNLITGALFFAMRSCEYSSTTKVDGLRKTKILTCENIRFFHNQGKGLTLLPHTLPLEVLEQADCLSICFVSQKNSENFTSVTQYRSGKELCPVTAWARTVKRILAYPKTSPTNTVNTFYDHTRKSLVRFSAAQIRAHIKLAVATIGPKLLGVQISKVGTHSLRTSCAMLLYLAKVRTETIKLIGRWKSDAFLLYIRRQVQEFAEGISEGMMSMPELFHNIPEAPSSNNTLHTTESNIQNNTHQHCPKW